MAEQQNPSGEQEREWDLKWDQLIAQAWIDPAFKKRLLSDPAAVFKEHGMETPPGAKVKIVENSEDTVHLILPAKPPAEELSEEELSNVAGGRGGHGGGHGGHGGRGGHGHGHGRGGHGGHGRRGCRHGCRHGCGRGCRHGCHGGCSGCGGCGGCVIVEVEDD